MIVAGFGFSTRATLASLRDALARTGGKPDALATAADKAAQLGPLAEALELPMQAISADRIKAQTTLTQSARAFQERGTGSLAEAAALAGAGPGARLRGPRILSGDHLAACALAEGKTP